MALQHNQIVIQMNEAHHLTSRCIQRRVSNVVSMIDEPGCSAGDLKIPFEQEMSMLKTISAALLAVSVLAAPALAAESGKTTAATAVIKTTKATQAKRTHAKIAQRVATSQATPSVLNANAKMGKHHHRKHVGHHRHPHGKMAAMKTTQPKAHAKTALKTSALKTRALKTAPRISLKPAASTTKRG